MEAHKQDAGAHRKNFSLSSLRDLVGKKVSMMENSVPHCCRACSQREERGEKKGQGQRQGWVEQREVRRALAVGQRCPPQPSDLVEEARLLDAPGLGLALVEEGGVPAACVHTLLHLLVFALRDHRVLVRDHLQERERAAVGGQTQVSAKHGDTTGAQCALTSEDSLITICPLMISTRGPRSLQRQKKEEAQQQRQRLARAAAEGEAGAAAGAAWVARI